MLAIPNVSEGRDAAAIEAIGEAFASARGVKLLDIHADPDHHRSVFTLAGSPGTLAPALANGAQEIIKRVDLRTDRGSHPHVGSLDVAPIVHLEPEDRGAACAEALLAAALLGDLGLPVYLYGALTGEPARTRAELRRGGLEGLRQRGTPPDFGRPQDLKDEHGATLVAARPPLIAFNFELAPPATLQDAKRIAAAIRSPHVKALGLELEARDGVAQVSTNIEDHRAAPLSEVLNQIEHHAEVQEAELVGLAPRQAFDGWPSAIPIRNHRTIEQALGQ